MDARIFVDGGEFDRLRESLKTCPDIFGKALRAALRRVGASMRKNIRKGVKGASYLKARDVASAIGKLRLESDEALVTVAGASLAGHKFRLVPNRVTARKGRRSIYWKVPLVKIGPDEKEIRPERDGFSKPFIARINGLKAMYWREKETGGIRMPPILPPQYFAAFDRVKDPVLSEAEKSFLRRLEREIDYRLSLKG